MESKEEKFVRLAEQRTNNAINKIRLVSNLSNKKNYEYSNDEVKEIFRAIDYEVSVAKKEFEKELKKQNSEFKFSKSKGER